METDINSTAMLMSCYVAVGDSQAARRTAHIALSGRKGSDTGSEQWNGHGLQRLCSRYLGEADAQRADDRALLIDPDNWNMRYNFACALLIHLKRQTPRWIARSSLGKGGNWLLEPREGRSDFIPSAIIRASRP